MAFRRNASLLLSLFAQPDSILLRPAPHGVISFVQTEHKVGAKCCQVRGSQ